MPYSLSYLNADCDFENLIIGMQYRKEARLCLYGPPGTGKTEFGSHIARQLGLPLIKKPASAIISRFIGETEKNIAELFELAKHEGALLMLDEADSFLQNRENSQHSWEITQVNELLVQMENFDGIFMASTNLINKLDSASLRRFDFKINFDYLTSKQRWDLFCSILIDKGTYNEQEVLEQKSKLNELSNLSPGDYLVVIRKHYIMMKNINAESLYQGLKTESLSKPNSTQRRIGFI